MVADILSGIHKVATLEETNEQYNININFLDYHSLKSKVSSYLELQEKTNYIEQLQRKSSTAKYRSWRSLLPLQRLSCSKENLLYEICDKWEEKTGLISQYHDSRSAVLHNRLLDDTYLKYIHFRQMIFYVN